MVVFIALMALCGAVSSFLMTWVFLAVIGLAVMPAYALVMIWQGTSPLIALAATFGGFVALQVAYAVTGAITEFCRSGSTSAVGADRGFPSRSPATSRPREDGVPDGAGSRDRDGVHDARNRIGKPLQESWPRLGGWLPLVAIRHVACQQDGSPWNGREEPGYRVRIFVAAWLGRGSSFLLGSPVRLDLQHQSPRTNVNSAIISLDAEIRHRRETHKSDESPISESRSRSCYEEDSSRR